MAGGKETPRQKMIGMMYLVLTALLALQVSNAVLEKFVFIDEALKRTVNELDQKNNKTLGNITAEVQKKGNRPDDVKALTSANAVRAKTKEILEYLSATREEMVNLTGGRDANDQLKGAKNYDIVSNWMIRKGEGKKLRDKLNTYASELSQITGGQFDDLAKDAKDIAIAANDPNQNKKNFTEYYFQNTPTAAGMATISHLESEVLNYETTALDLLAGQVGAKDVEFDKIVPLVRPASNVVASGAKFEAQLFITASSSGLNPVFKQNNQEVKQGLTENGIKFGQIEFTASATNYDPKTLLAEKSFEAEIELNDSTYKIKHDYFVVKPVIQVRSAALSALYLKCGNDLDVQVPALGTNYNPTFSVSQGRQKKGTKTGLVTVIPEKQGSIVLTVRNNGSTIGSEKFQVKKVPLPTYEIKSGNSVVNLKDGVKIARLSRLSIKAVPDENFKREVPKDARYRLSDVQVILARGTRPIKTLNFKNGTLNLQQLRSVARAGDRLSIEVKKCSRRNFLNESERVPTKNVIYNVPLN